MTDKPTPKEIDDLVYELRQAGKDDTYSLASAVLAKWGQPAQAAEPVAWQYRSMPDVGGVWFDCTKERADLRAARPEIWEVRALYAAPPTAQAEPRRRALLHVPV